MIRYSDAIQIIREAAQSRSDAFSREAEFVGLESCVGRISAEEITAREAIPPFDNSAMDGFALRAQATSRATLANPVKFTVQGMIAAGVAPMTSESDERASWEIMTGAPIPPGFDAVVKIEDVEVRRDADGRALEIWVSKPLSTRENFRGAGKDFKIGQKVLHAGSQLGAEHVMALASLGHSQVKVARRPRIALISTGDEIVDHTHQSLQPGMIRNSTAPHLLAALPGYGCDAKFYGTVRDDQSDRYVSLVRKAIADGADLILSTGAVSKGKFDFVPDALSALGAVVRFHEVAIRPGKPGLFAELGSAVLFGIPGNPVSTAVALRFFVSRYVEALQGREAELPLRAILREGTEKPEGLRCFFKAEVTQESGRLEVRCLPGQPSFMVSPLLSAQAWAVLPEEGSIVHERTEVDLYPLHPITPSLVTVSPLNHSTAEKGCC